MSWERKIDLTIGDTDVVKHEATLVGTLLGAETDWTVEGEKFDTRAEAIERAVEIEDKKRS